MLETFKYLDIELIYAPSIHYNMVNCDHKMITMVSNNIYSNKFLLSKHSIQCYTTTRDFVCNHGLKVFGASMDPAHVASTHTTQLEIKIDLSPVFGAHCSLNFADTRVN